MAKEYLYKAYGSKLAALNKRRKKKRNTMKKAMLSAAIIITVAAAVILIIAQFGKKSNELVGTWRYDEHTQYVFEKDGTGKFSLSDEPQPSRKHQVTRHPGLPTSRLHRSTQLQSISLRTETSVSYPSADVLSFSHGSTSIRFPYLRLSSRRPSNSLQNELGKSFFEKEPRSRGNFPAIQATPFSRYHPTSLARGGQLTVRYILLFSMSFLCF